MVVIKSLYRSNYTPRPTEINDFIAIAKSLLSRCAGIIYMQNSLEPQGEKYNLLINSFKLELIGMRDCLLYVFAMMYDRENINKVRIAYATEKKESIINAMEIIDIAVRKDIGSNFNIIFEPGNISERMHSLRKVYPIEFFENVERVLINILAENAKPYSNWTMACSLYTSKKQQHGIDNSLIVKYTTAENRLLRETALFAL
jgi:ATP:ADP antiporter, AAA family